MTYLIFALKTEAQAFIDKKLNVNIVISGIGSRNIYNVTKNIVDKMNKDDIIVNVGICGACDDFKIGDLLEVNPNTLKIDNRWTLSCVDYEVGKIGKYDVVDMESTGFIDATKNTNNRYIFKIVSDHFEPNKITKDGAKRLIFNKIDEIMRRIKR